MTGRTPPATRKPASGIPALLARHTTDSPPKSAAEAAVLIVLREGATGVETLLIERTIREDDPASGQVSLPGGHVDPTDTSLRDTALRELSEEVGLSSSDLSRPPLFVSIVTTRHFKMRVGVFASALGPRAPDTPRPSPREVAHVFWLPRSTLGELVRVTQDTPRGRVEVDAVVYRDHVVWGLTLRILGEFFGAVQREPSEHQGGAQGAPS